MTYKPRRASSRWLDLDCPPEVLAIKDSGPKVADRYTVIYAPPSAGTTYADMVLGYRGMSESPCHPQGVGMWGEFSAHECAAFRYRTRSIAWSKLPYQVRDCVRRDCESFRQQESAA